MGGCVGVCLCEWVRGCVCEYACMYSARVRVCARACVCVRVCIEYVLVGYIEP